MAYVMGVFSFLRDERMVVGDLDCFRITPHHGSWLGFAFPVLCFRFAGKVFDGDALPAVVQCPPHFLSGQRHRFVKVQEESHCDRSSPSMQAGRPGPACSADRSGGSGKATPAPTWHIGFCLKGCSVAHGIRRVPEGT